MSFVTILLFVTVVTAVRISKEVTFNPTRENQIDFDLKQLSGLWYIIWKSKEFVQDDPVHIKSKVFYSNTKGSISFVEINVRDNKFCVAGETEVAKQKNHVYMTEENVPVEVISTDYNSTALFRYCTNVIDSTCHPNHYYFEIASRKPTMEPDDEIRILTEIYRVSGRYEEMTYLSADCEGGNVIFNTIPVTASFSLNNIIGDSFALAQTDFTEIKPLLTHNIYLPQLDLVAGWFTLINCEQNTCSPVMQSMTKVSPSNNGILYSKLGDFQSKKRWGVSKTLYSDKHYTLSYFCFEKFYQSCSRDKTEVRLDSRQKDIDPDFKRTLFQLLQKVCLTADSMKDIEYKINCTSSLKEVVDKEQKQFKNSVGGVCRKENMPIADYNHGEIQMNGTWYAIAVINSIPGFVMNVTQLHDSLIIDYCGIKDNNCQWSLRTKITQICPGKAHFMQTFVDTQEANMSLIFEYKAAYIDEQTQFIYSCNEETDGECPSILLKVYSRQKQMTNSTLEKLKNFLPFLCLNISHLNTIEFPSLNFSEPMKLMDYTSTECSVENIPGIEHFNQSKLLGTWYELAHTEYPPQLQKKGTKHTHRVEFIEDTDGLLKVAYQYDNNRTDTSSAFAGDIQPQCVDHLNGHFTAKYTFSTLVKILYTDYENITIIFLCAFINENDGECSMPMVYIISRKLELTTNMLSVAESVLNKVCINPDNIQIAQDVSESEVNHSCITVNSTEWKRGRQSR